MEKSRGRLRLHVGLFLFLLLLLLLPQASLEARSQLIVNLMDTSDEVQLVCRDDNNFQQAATFTLINPVNGLVEREVNISRSESLDISVFPHNETIVRCRVMNSEFEESESIAIAGRPEFTDRKPNTVQYVFSDNTDGVNFSCPLSEPGQLFGMSNFTPYDYVWQFKPSREIRESNENFTLFDDNRTLHVHLPTSEDYRFECHANIRRCNSSRTIRCGAIRTTNTMLYPSPPGFQVKIIDLNITVDPPTAHVTQNDLAVFTCEATGLETYDIKWEVDGIFYDIEVCEDMDNCTVIANGHTSTLKLNTEHIEPSTLAIVCVVNLPDKALLENDTTEVILPNITSRTMRSRGVQLEIMPRPSTTPSTGPLSTSPKDTGLGSNELIIIVVSIAFFFLLLLIVILAFCVVCIYHCHYKKYDSGFGRKLRRTFDRNATNQLSSSHEIELEHSHGIDSPSLDGTDAHVNTGGTVSLTNHADSDGNHGDHISDVHTYSSISNVIEYDSTHHTPCQHNGTSTDLQEESTGDAAAIPHSGSAIMPLDDTTGVSMKENESYRPTTAIHSIRNPAYGTNIAIAPWIDTQENVAYKSSID